MGYNQVNIQRFKNEALATLEVVLAFCSSLAYPSHSSAVFCYHAVIACNKVLSERLEPRYGEATDRRRAMSVGRSNHFGPIGCEERHNLGGHQAGLSHLKAC